eukprot:359667-Chlamydomonas_euryale.AAC.4
MRVCVEGRRQRKGRKTSEVRTCVCSLYSPHLPADRVIAACIALPASPVSTRTTGPYRRRLCPARSIAQCSYAAAAAPPTRNPPPGGDPIHAPFLPHFAATRRCHAVTPGMPCARRAASSRSSVRQTHPRVRRRMAGPACGSCRCGPACAAVGQTGFLGTWLSWEEQASAASNGRWSVQLMQMRIPTRAVEGDRGEMAKQGRQEAATRDNKAITRGNKKDER